MSPRRSTSWRGAPPPHLSWSQSPPRIHVPGGSVSANSLMRRANSSGESASRRSTLESWNPPSMKWVWLSMNPGSTIRPPNLTTSVPSPRRARTSRSVPTAWMNPPFTATACAGSEPGTPVQTVPPRKMMSAGTSGAGAQPATARSRIREQRRTRKQCRKTDMATLIVRRRFERERMEGYPFTVPQIKHKGRGETQPCVPYPSPVLTLPTRKLRAKRVRIRAPASNSSTGTHSSAP